MTSPERITKGLYWDRAWSLVRGCTKVSEGCRHCWAERESHMRTFNPNEKIKAQYSGLTDGDGRFNGQIRLMENNLDLPLRVKKPMVWAVWNDLFHEDVPFEFIGKAFARMHNTRYHTFMVLTKRPDRMAEFINWYKTDWLAGFEYAWPKEYQHVWLGVTAENHEQADKRIPILLQTPAAVRFVSVEPMLRPVSLAGFDGKTYRPWLDSVAWKVGINWVICGSESGASRRPAKAEWIRGLKNQCVEAGVPFFLKQMEVNGKLVKMPELDGRTWNEFPKAGDRCAKSAQSS